MLDFVSDSQNSVSISRIHSQLTIFFINYFQGVVADISHICTPAKVSICSKLT